MNKSPHQYPKLPYQNVWRYYWCEDKRGFTLIEVMISLLILAAVSGYFVYFFRTSIYSQNNANALFAALNKAQEKMEEERALPFEEIKSDGAQFEVKDISSDLKEITFTLSWNSKRPPIVLYTMRAR